MNPGIWNTGLAFVDWLSSAISGPDHPASIEGDYSAQFPVSRHSIGATDFRHRDFGNAATTLFNNDHRIRFERPVETKRADLPFQRMEFDSMKAAPISGHWRTPSLDRINSRPAS
jgi:hypothetical protein